MATALSYRFSGVRILLGDGATPEVFAAPCGFTERSISFNNELGETNSPDCADEDAAAYTERDVVSTSVSISGQGVLAVDSIATWIAYFASKVSKNCRAELWRNGVITGYWAGAFQMESLEIGATKGERATLQVSLQSDGAVAWTAS